MYKLNFSLLLHLLTPTPLRLPRFLALVRVFCGHIALLHADFLNTRKRALYEAAHGSQVAYLEKYLNDRFSPQNRRISIVDGEELLPADTVFYTQAEAVQDNPVLYAVTEGKGPVFDAEHVYTQHDFIVEINNTQGDCAPDTAELHAVIRRRKLPGVTYKVETIIN